MRYLDFAGHATTESRSETVISLIDLSNSMEDDDWKPSRKAGAVKANKELIKIKARQYPQDKVGMIGFGTTAEVLHEPVAVGKGNKSLNKALRGLSCMGWTNFTAALTLAECSLLGREVVRTGSSVKGIMEQVSELLYGSPQATETHIRETSSSKKCSQRIILLTDGDWNEGGSPAEVAGRLKDAGVIIDCIGIASKGEVEEDKLKEIASRNADGSIRYCWIGSKQQLIKKYQSLAHHIRPL